jgi:hypothetical protein
MTVDSSTLSMATGTRGTSAARNLPRLATARAPWLRVSARWHRGHRGRFQTIILLGMRMTQIDRRAVNGAFLTVDLAGLEVADSNPAHTCEGVFRPSGRDRSIPATAHPTVRCDRLQEIIAIGELPGLRYELHDEFERHGGLVRSALVWRPTATGGEQEFAYAQWDGKFSGIGSCSRTRANEVDGAAQTCTITDREVR